MSAEVPPSPAKDRPAARCPACDTERMGRFCHKCGQDNRHERLRTRDVLSKWTHVVTDANSTIWTTLRRLTVAPGAFVREYVEGKRSGRFPPFRYLLLTTAASIALTALIVPTLIPPMDMTAPNAGNQREATEFMMRWMSAIVILSLPVSALATRLLFWKSGRNFAENCALMAYLYAHTNVLTLLLAPIAHADYWSWQISLVVAQFLYVTWGLKGFFGGSLVGVTLRSIALTIVYFGCISVLAIGVVAAFTIAGQLG